MTARRCAVIGGGIAGASVAASLARRGWQVQVLDAAAQPAAGASGLPVGLFAPHVSPDDAILSRLTRAGVQATLQQARALLVQGQDWNASGVLEHGVKGARRLPAHDTGSRPATPADRAAAGLAADAPALWHTQAGWLKPAPLVRALLALSGVEWRGLCAVARLARESGGWQVLDAAGQCLAEVPLVVVAAGPHSAALLGGRLPLQPLRGQIAWGRCGDARLPPFPVNGHGSLVAGIAHEGAAAWFVGSTFERASTDTQVRPDDHAANLARLQLLLPAAARELAPQFSGAAGSPAVRGWAGVRATLPDRLPAVGPVDEAAAPGLWACTGMGSRGLTLAVLCGELLAARASGEPAPLAPQLAAALAAQRYTR
ncbi:MAG: FAD-dependent 5-carboxymethylaminomethyl-2-thiouridine(34) oxidoreductase MnmC [Ramlibacter sp.]|jgi:tRNA 5-methylaminomethyl-2-thiouridine biosynthesis bifunctional protein|nr:FAD-dependent 5-carboxymethylaminomethyl-2-thiouridine(34) oxidoreductase MnmC [Ramlibacter sp.]